jgi:NRAMP (natural resistance-associated macrophage protein)-like metal ion transporter
MKVDKADKEPIKLPYYYKRPSQLKKSSSSSSFKNAFKSLGPGLVTGASDNDPSGIATYSQAGAKFGYGPLWMAIITFPMLLTIEEMCARIGLVSGKGLSQIIKENYSYKLLYVVSSLLLIANTINIGADIGAMGASLRLLVPQVPFILATLTFTAIILTAEIFIPYNTYSRVLKFFAFSLFIYVLTAFLVVHNTEWGNIAKSTLIPHFEFKKDFILMFIAILGTTISPYLFFWQTAQEVEEEVREGKVKEMGESDGGSINNNNNNCTNKNDNKNINNHPIAAKKDVKKMRMDVIAGMALSQTIFWFIIITSASVLHNNGVTNIASAQEAAKALQPLVKMFPYSGQIASGLFAAGIIGTGLLAVPVLAGSASYAVSECFSWKEGLYKKFLQAPKFYGVIIASTVIGLWINFSNIDPIQALIYTAVINGIVSVPLLIIIMKIANSKKILGDKVNNKVSNIIALVTIIAMVSASAAMAIYNWIL